jgi:hypothetical protein
MAEGAPVVLAAGSAGHRELADEQYFMREARDREAQGSLTQSVHHLFRSDLPDCAPPDTLWFYIYDHAFVRNNVALCSHPDLFKLVQADFLWHLPVEQSYGSIVVLSHILQGECRSISTPGYCC